MFSAVLLAWRYFVLHRDRIDKPFCLRLLKCTVFWLLNLFWWCIHILESPMEFRSLGFILLSKDSIFFYKKSCVLVLELQNSWYFLPSKRPNSIMHVLNNAHWNLCKSRISYVLMCWVINLMAILRNVSSKIRSEMKVYFCLLSSVKENWII